MKRLIICAAEAEHEAAEFGEAFHAADGGVAGGDAERFLQVVHHVVAVIGAEGELCVGAVLFGAAVLFGEKFSDDGGHVERAGEMLGFMEGAVGIALRAAKMDGVDARCKAVDDGGDVIVGAGAEGAGAEAEAVGGGGIELEDFFDVIGGGDNAREAEDGEGGIVGVDGEAGADLFGGGEDGVEEAGEVFSEVGGGDVVIAGKHGTDLVEREAELAAGENVDDGLDELLLGVGRERIPPLGGFGLLIGGVVGGGVLAFQGVDFKSGEGDGIEAEGLGTVGEGEAHVGADPIEDGHEIVDDGVDAFGSEVADGVFVVVEETREVAFADFDVFVDGDGFGDIPAEAGGFDKGFAFADGFARPRFTVGNFMEGGEDSRGTGLAEIGERNLIIGSEPAE